MKRLLAFAFFAVSPLGACAATPGADGYFPLIIHCSCSDTVGRSFARSLREEIARRPRYMQVSRTEAAIAVDIISVAIDSDESGQSQQTALSVVFRMKNEVLDQAVQTCGAAATERCARKTVDVLDELAAKVIAGKGRE